MKLVVCLLAVCGGASMLSAGPIINVYPALAPELIGPSGPSWINNAVHALENGLSTYGNPNLPDYYQQRTVFGSNENIITLYPSWHGQINPGTNYGPAYANELGNRIHFGLTIDGNGSQFSISELSVDVVSSDVANGLAFSIGAGNFQYSSAYVGIIFGSTHSLNAPDNTYITSGANTQMVDALVGRGAGIAWLSCGTPDPNYPCADDASKQASLNRFATLAPNPYTMTATYALARSGVQGAGVATINPVPEPVESGVVGLALLAIAACRVSWSGIRRGYSARRR